MQTFLQNLFTKTALFFVLVACVATSCDPDEPKPEEKYPKDISFTEYSLNGTFCQWTNLPYDEKIMIINSTEELEKYITCTSGRYPFIDFSKNTLLLTSGLSTNNIPEITLTKLQQSSLNQFQLDIEITINAVVREKEWVKAVIIEKINQTSNVDLNITLEMQIDFNNIENLFEQPLPVIQKCLNGKWELNISLENVYTIHGTVNIDTENNSLQVIIDEKDTTIFYWLAGYYPPTPLSFSWKKTEFPEYGQVFSWYVMWLDDEIKHYNPQLEEFIYVKTGWFFRHMRNGSVNVMALRINNPNSNPQGYYLCYLTRITE